MKQRIISEATKKLKEKFAEKRKKEIEKLDERLKKGKFTKKQYKEKIWQFDNLVENSVQNEIAKRIEKAHSYSFNLQNYRSNLSDEQKQDWRFHTASFTPFGGKGTKGSLEHKYESLQKAKSLNAVQILGTFNPDSALEMDIAREYLSKLKVKSKKLEKLEEILKESFKYSLVDLEILIIPKYEKIKKEDYRGDFDIIDKISFSDGKIHLRKTRETGMDLYKINQGDLVTSKINIHQGATAISDDDLVASTHYQIYEINLSEVMPKYLLLMMRTKKFIEIINIEKAGGIKNEAGAEFLSKFQIPLPPLEVQQEIVEKIERQKGIIEGVDKISGNLIADDSIFSGDLIRLGEVINTQYGYTDSAHDKGKFRLVRITDIDNFGRLIKQDIVFVDIKNKKDQKLYLLSKSDLLLVRTGATFGKILYFEDTQKSVFASYLIRLAPKNNRIDKKYLWYYSFSQMYWKQAREFVDGGTQPQFNANKIIKIKIPLPSLNIQKQIVTQLDKEMEALEKVRVLKGRAKERIDKILAEVWGG